MRWHHGGMAQPNEEWVTIASFENLGDSPGTMAIVRA